MNAGVNARVDAGAKEGVHRISRACVHLSSRICSHLRSQERGEELSEVKQERDELQV